MSGARNLTDVSKMHNRLVWTELVNNKEVIGQLSQVLRVLVQLRHMFSHLCVHDI